MGSDDLEKIKAAVLAAPQDINKKVSPFAYYRMMRGDTALQMALYRERPQQREIVEYLVAHGADVNARDSTGQTPLTLAHGNQELTDFLISKGAHFDIFTAVTLNRLDQIELRLKENPEHAQATLETGETPLFRAQSLAATELLLTYGSNVNHRDSWDRTPLWNVRDRAIAELFLAYGADIHARSHYFQCTPLYAAALSGSADVLELLLEQGADPKAAVSKSGTVLHNVENQRVVELLLRHGVDVNVRSERGDTALFHATEPMLRFLISKGADVNAHEQIGRTALHGFAQINHVSEARVLIANGADINKADKYGQTPLHFAYHKAMIEVLIAQGANINACDLRGRTPLHCKKNVDAMEFLMGKGAKINARDTSGETPLTALKHLEEQAAALRKLGGIE